LTSRGGDIGSLFILTESGDDDGGGVLLLTDKCGKPAFVVVDGLDKIKSNHQLFSQMVVPSFIPSVC